MSKREAPHADITLDVKGVSCPGPLVGAKRLVDDLHEGGILLLISDCPGTEADLFAWARVTGNQVIDIEKLAQGGHGYYIRKGSTRHPRANAVLDARGSVCPGPIVEARRLLATMSSGEVLRLVSDCPGVRGDIAGWADATGMQLVDSAEIGPGQFEFYIRKG
jgi:TusA-related sulfurtransferase